MYFFDKIKFKIKSVSDREKITPEININGDIEGAVVTAIEAIDPQQDMRGPIEFKKHVASIILRRAIARAQSRAA